MRLAVGPRTLRARVAIGTAIVLATALTLVATFVDDRFRRQANARLDASLEVEVDAIASLARFEEGRLELTIDGVARLGPFEVPRSGAYYVLIGPGVPELRSASLAGRGLEGAVAQASSRHRSGVTSGPYESRVRWTVRHVRLEELRHREAGRSPASPELPVDVYVARSTAEVDEARTELRRELALAVPLGLLIGTAGAFLLAGRATAPIRRLSDEARAVGTRGAGSRLDLRRMDGELRELAETLNAAFDRLEVAAERERLFAAAASHELRTPLAVLRTRLEVTLSRDRPLEQCRDALRTALEAGVRLTALTESLLQLARLERSTIDRRPIDLARVIDAAVLRGAPGDASRVVRSGESVHVQGNLELLERLFAGLVENARTHGADADVEVRLRRDAERAIVEVLDRGPGFPPDLLPRLFEPFIRGETSRSRATGGAGLGLSIARAIVVAHDGRITASQRPDGGAMVTVTLPTEAAAPRARGIGTDP